MSVGELVLAVLVLGGGIVALVLGAELALG